MIRHKPREQILAACLSSLAGFVDAIGFLALGGYFVSFMSGNSTRLAVGLAEGASEALIAGALIAGFVLGVVVGSLAGRAVPAARRRATVLLFVSALLALAAALDLAGLPTGIAIAFVVLAMGAENTVFERDGEVAIGLTYMTGNLVKLGQRIAAALRGGDRRGWVPYLFLWLGLVLGAVVGAIAWSAMGLAALWIAAGAAAFFALVAALFAPE